MSSDIWTKLPPEELLHAYDAAEGAMRTAAKKRRSLATIVKAGERSEEIRDEILRRLKEHAT